ncbi:SRPBCC domain-containing protein [Actinophytocola sp.]|uniref:SRPBCC domain-containing protein n=1 Tax=Actinophytocola sp. TaxID=1872138 RepID=UPI003D6B4E98
MEASPTQVWAVLVEATAWPHWYGNARAVTITGHARLVLGAQFRWRTFRLPVRSTVTAFEPERHLAWDGHSLGSSGYHRWILQAQPDGGTRVITEEVQKGVAVSMVAPVMRRALLRAHHHWITELGHQATARTPTLRPPDMLPPDDSATGTVP